MLDLAEGDRRPDRVQELLSRAVAGEQVERRNEAEPATTSIAGPRGLVRRPELVVLLRRPEGATRRSTAQFVMPGHVTGRPMPGFLGGSDLAVPAASSNKALAADWIKDFTDTSSEKGLQAKGNIPNTTNLLGWERATSGLASPELVRSDGEELGRTSRTATSSATCWGRSSPATDRQAGGPVGQRQHRIGAEPAVTGARRVVSNGTRRRDLASGVSAATPFLDSNRARGGAVRADRPDRGRDRGRSSATRSTGSSSSRCSATACSS